MPNKTKYLVTLNWYGEVHTIYTSSSTEQRALNNAICQLAAKVGYCRSYVKCFFLGEKDNFKIVRR
jgi:hypothetical protein